MKKQAKWWLIGASVLGLSAAVVVPSVTLSCTSHNNDVTLQTRNLVNNLSSSVSSTATSNSSSNSSGQESIQQIIDAINKKFQEMLQKNGIALTYTNGTVNITVDAQKAPKMQHMTATDIKNVNVPLVVDIIQHTLISMGILPPDAQLFLTVKDLTFTNDNTTANFSLDMVWSNQLPVKHFAVNVQINNLYPVPPQTQTSVQSDDVVGSNTLAWTLAGVFVGFGLVCLLAVIIYIQIRKINMKDE